MTNVVTEVPPGSIWRHKRMGGLYVVVGECRLESTWEPAVLYRPLDPSEAWATEPPIARARAEFLDGRFMRVSAKPLKDDAVPYMSHGIGRVDVRPSLADAMAYGMSASTVDRDRRTGTIRGTRISPFDWRFRRPPDEAPGIDEIFKRQAARIERLKKYEAALQEQVDEEACGAVFGAVREAMGIDT